MSHIPPFLRIIPTTLPIPQRKVPPRNLPKISCQILSSANHAPPIIGAEENLTSSTTACQLKQSRRRIESDSGILTKRQNAGYQAEKNRRINLHRDTTTAAAEREKEKRNEKGKRTSFKKNK